MTKLLSTFDPTRIAADRAVIKGATPGPWEWDFCAEYEFDVEAERLINIIYLEDDYPGYPECGEHLIMNLSKADATFIAAARTGWPEALDEVERLQAENAALREAQRWIPVSERLPNTNRPVQVYMPKLYMSVQTGFYDRYYGEDDSEWYEHWVAPGEVTHWMPLPAPPEEGKQK